MNIIIVSEENHGEILYCRTFESVVKGLINHGWLNERTDVWDNNVKDMVTVKEYYGDDWENEMISRGAEDFCEVWDGSFYLRDDVLIEVE